MLNKGLILGFVLLVSQLSVKAQQHSAVEVAKDSLIALLQTFRAENEINPTSARNTISLGTKPVNKTRTTRTRKKGFRVQIYLGSNRNDAYATQSRFRGQHADMDSYINYDEPNYRVKVGDFTSRTEANNFMRTLRNQYSNVFVVQEDIWVWE